MNGTNNRTQITAVGGPGYVCIRGRSVLFGMLGAGGDSVMGYGFVP